MEDWDWFKTVDAKYIVNEYVKMTNFLKYITCKVACF